MELKQAAQDLKDLRAIRSQTQKKPDVTRYVIWGALSVCTVLAAALSIALAVSASRTPVKPIQATANAPAAKSAPAPATSPSASASQPQLPAIPTKSPTEIEITKLQDALRALAAERDRLVNRVDQLERNVGDITASITKEKEKPAAPPPAPPQQNVRTDNAIQPAQGRSSPAMPLARPDNAPGQQQMAMRGQQRPADDEDDEPPSSRNSAPNNPGTFNRTTANARQQIHPQPVPQAPPGANRLQFPQQQAMPQSTDSTATRTEFAIDLGGEASIDGLRALWANVRGNHGAALEGLRPLVSVRDGVKAGTVELRLVAGPLANASAAARACALLQQKGVPCQTTIFDGQRLALR